MPYYLDVSGELLDFDYDLDGPQPPLTPEQLAAIRTALMDTLPSGLPSGVLDVQATKNSQAELALRLTINPEVWIGPDVWPDCVQHAADVGDITPEQVAIEGYLAGGPLDELADMVNGALGGAYDFSPDSSVKYGPLT